MNRELALDIEVLGEAKPAGSKRAFKHPTTGKIIVKDDSKGSKPWKQEIAGTAREAFARCPDCQHGRVIHLNGQQTCSRCNGSALRGLLTGPIAVELVFYRRRPAGHFGSGRNAHKLRPSAPSVPATRPDVLKLARAVEDSLTGVIWRDDAQIVEEVLRKFYGEPERTVIRVWALRELHQPQLKEVAA